MRTRVFVLLIALAGLSACYKSRLPPGTCENDQMSELLSPDKQWKSVLFQRQCGAEVSEIHVSVLPATATLPNQPGNAFRQDATGEGPRSSHSFDQTWKRPRELWIGRDQTMKVALTASEVGPVKVVHLGWRYS
jgi:hypothetical protein